MSADIYEELIATAKAWRPIDSYDAATTETKRAALLVSRAATEINRLRSVLWSIGHAAGIETKEDLMKAALDALPQSK